VRGVATIAVVIFAITIVVVSIWLVHRIEKDYEIKEKKNVRRKK